MTTTLDDKRDRVTDLETQISELRATMKSIDQVPCPRCKAKPGNPCTTRLGNKAKSSHDERHNACTKEVGPIYAEMGQLDAEKSTLAHEVTKEEREIRIKQETEDIITKCGVHTTVTVCRLRTMYSVLQMTNSLAMHPGDRLEEGQVQSLIDAGITVNIVEEPQQPHTQAPPFPFMRMW